MSTVIRGGGRSARLVQPFEKNLNLTIIGPTRTQKIQGFDNKRTRFLVRPKSEWSDQLNRHAVDKSQVAHEGFLWNESKSK